MANIKAEVIVKGAVQKARYRDYVQEKARSLNVKGYVESLRDGSVRIVCETDEDTLKDFIKLINIKQDLITVEKMETIKKQPATGEYEYFDIKHGSMEEEMGERMVAAVKIAVATRQDIKDMHQDMKNMHHDLNGSIQLMHQDLKGSIQSMHKDLKQSTESMRQDLKGSIESMHQDMNLNFKEMAERYDVISAELLRTREELKIAVDNLVRVVQKFLEKPA
ncbi:acylphosphatase [Candidatus Bathyarchaeota archaeon]|nr:acylphosphatase [Candidatus Bathyarchaeota archaeon]